MHQTLDDVVLSVGNPEDLVAEVLDGFKLNGDDAESAAKLLLPMIMKYHEIKQEALRLTENN